METARKILTPQAIWSDFDDSLPLKDLSINEMSYDGITYSEVYFSGRETGSGRVRIYGLYARPKDLPANRKMGGVLILPDYTETVNLDCVNHYVRQGYFVLMVDYRGEYGETKDYTKYPTEIEYANCKKAGDVFKVERSAKECCWYEWAAVAKYAIAFLRSRSEVDKIALIGIKQGANVGWQALFGDKNVSCFVSVYGMGWQAYKGVFRHVSADIDLDDERYLWLGGVDAHVYAQHVNCPVLYVAGTNSPDFDCDRAIDTLTRLKPEVKYSFNYAPRFRDTINKRCGDDISLFIKKHLARDGVNTDKIYFPDAPVVRTAVGEDPTTFFAEVEFAMPDKLKSVSVYLSEGIAAPGRRNWAPMQYVKQNAAKKFYMKKLGGGADFCHVFAVAEYKNGVTVSSKIAFSRLNDHVLPRSSNMIYSSGLGTDCFCVSNEKKNTIGNFIFDENDGVILANCANGITGVSSRYGLLTYKIGENRFKPERRSIVKFDVYCDEYTKLYVSLMNSDEIGNLTPYTVKVELNGCKVWQNVQIAFFDFKSECNFGLREFDNIAAIKLEAESLFAVNNVLLI